MKELYLVRIDGPAGRPIDSSIWSSLGCAKNAADRLNEAYGGNARVVRLLAGEKNMILLSAYRSRCTWGSPPPPRPIPDEHPAVYLVYRGETAGWVDPAGGLRGVHDDACKYPMTTVRDMIHSVWFSLAQARSCLAALEHARIEEICLNIEYAC